MQSLKPEDSLNYQSMIIILIKGSTNNI